jgi:hypothetical protein
MSFFRKLFSKLSSWFHILFAAPVDSRVFQPVDSRASKPVDWRPLATLTDEEVEQLAAIRK